MEAIVPARHLVRRGRFRGCSGHSATIVNRSFLTHRVISAGSFAVVHNTYAAVRSRNDQDSL
jgi:hypothetical protein